MGLNTVATYIFWNYHHPTPGTWDFKTGSHNLPEFLKTAQEEGLFVILRPGPYACAEWEFGGYPWWLQQNKNLVIRANNQPFLDSCNVYLRKLAGQVKGYQGPFFTSDASTLFEGGATPGTLPTANGEDNVERLKKSVNQYNNNLGPYMVAEYYPGWLDHWGEPFTRVGTEQVTKQVETYLKNEVSFNFYMVHGGTNFGFTAGANYNEEHHIQPDITSYDYDAPISEAGWATPKYTAVRELMKRYVKYPVPAVPAPIPVITLPPITLSKSVDLFDLKRDLKPVSNDTPLS
nr:hypothetical protein [Tanacetum cinerariifolium]